ncbi:hypothetical protein ACJ2A9_14090 [Anaerobacillus sp. MEB173]|uniref:hypothetical protein n=1 Tax=Anaerobacillus sp. MEB173 TaxID=3383345 RepID=UPI003F8EA453
MIDAIFIWSTLIITYLLSRHVFKKEKKVRNIYLLFSGITAAAAIFLHFNLVFNGYLDFLSTIFGGFTSLVIGQ